MGIPRPHFENGTITLSESFITSLKNRDRKTLAITGGALALLLAVGTVGGVAVANQRQTDESCASALAQLAEAKTPADAALTDADAALELAAGSAGYEDSANGASYLENVNTSRDALTAISFDATCDSVGEAESLAKTATDAKAQTETLATASSTLSGDVAAVRAAAEEKAKKDAEDKAKAEAEAAAAAAAAGEAAPAEEAAAADTEWTEDTGSYDAGSDWSEPSYDQGWSEPSYDQGWSEPSYDQGGGDQSWSAPAPAPAYDGPSSFRVGTGEDGGHGLEGHCYTNTFGGQYGDAC